MRFRGPSVRTESAPRRRRNNVASQCEKVKASFISIPYRLCFLQATTRKFLPFLKNVTNSCRIFRRLFRFSAVFGETDRTLSLLVLRRLCIPLFFAALSCARTIRLSLLCGCGSGRRDGRAPFSAARHCGRAGRFRFRPPARTKKLRARGSGGLSGSVSAHMEKSRNFRRASLPRRLTNGRRRSTIR